MSDFFPNKTTSFIVWLKAFAEGVKRNKAVLKLTDAEAEEFNEVYIELNEAERRVVEAKNMYRAAVKGRDEKKKAAIKKVRLGSAGFHANRDCPATVLKGLGLQPHKKTRSLDSPLAPASLFAKPISKDINLLTWKGNGNKRHTMYIVEVKFAGDKEFRLVNGGMSTKYKHRAPKPYAKAYYRVYAKRREVVSDYSNIVGVYLV